jgi:hypothetical protein
MEVTPPPVISSSLSIHLRLIHSSAYSTSKKHLLAINHSIQHQSHVVASSARIILVLDYDVEGTETGGRWHYQNAY